MAHRRNLASIASSKYPVMVALCQTKLSSLAYGTFCIKYIFKKFIFLFFIFFFVFFRPPVLEEREKLNSPLSVSLPLLKKSLRNMMQDLGKVRRMAAYHWQIRQGTWGEWGGECSPPPLPPAPAQTLMLNISWEERWYLWLRSLYEGMMLKSSLTKKGIPKMNAWSFR